MNAYSKPRSWNRTDLEAVGFAGFLPLVGLDTGQVPTGHGVYVVLRPDASLPHDFLEENPVKSARIAIYSTPDLGKRWVAGSPVVYIGKAMGAKGLRDRLKPYSRKSSGHTGGRAIWQLTDAEELLVCWVETPDHVAKEVETQYIKAFKRAFGRGPFANISEA